MTQIHGIDAAGNDTIIQTDERGRQTVSNGSSRFRDAFETFDTINTWFIEAKAAGDIIRVDGNSASASYLDISLDPLSAGTETIVRGNKTFKMPYRLGLGLCCSQRVLGSYFSCEAVSTDTALGPLPLIPPVAIATMSQATTTLTVTTATPHNLKPGMCISICQCADSRFNYPSLVVATIPSATRFTVTAGPMGTIPSLTAGPVTSGNVCVRSRLGYARNGLSMLLEGSSATSASFYARSESGDALPSGTIAGNHTVSIGSTAPVQLVNTPFCYSFTPTTLYELIAQLEAFTWLDKTIDSTNAIASIRSKREQVIPDPDDEYKFRFRAVNDTSLVVPTAQIVSITKTASTTCTVTTATPHGLTVSDYVNIYGVADQTNFAQSGTSAVVASVIDATRFTVVWGISATATSYGGYVSRSNGAVTQPGALSQVISSVSRTSNVTTVNSTATWAGISIGDYVNLVGVRNLVNGSSLGIDGAYRVANMATTVLTLEPLDANGQGSDITLTNAGGGVIKRTCLRVSFVRIMEFSRLVVESYGGFSRSDLTMCNPVYVSNTPSVTLSGTSNAIAGVAAHDATLTGNPVRIAGRALTANYAAVASGDIADLVTTLVGALIQKPYSIPEADWSTASIAGGIVNTTDVVLQTAAGAGLRRYVTGMTISNNSATATEFVIKDGAIVIWRDMVKANQAPIFIGFPTPLKTTANAALNAACITTGAAVYCNAQGYTAP